MNNPRIKVWRSGHGTTDVTVYGLHRKEMVEFFGLFDIWGSHGYNRWNDGGLYFECPGFFYDIVEGIPFIQRDRIIVEKEY